MVAPFGDAFAQQRRQLFEQGFEFGRYGDVCLGAIAAIALLGFVAAQQGVEFLGHQFAMHVQGVQESAAVGVAHRLGDPGQIVVARRQDVGLLVVQVLDAVLHAAQEGVGVRERLGRLAGHQPGTGQALEGVEGGAAAQFGELPAAHHLQQLHGELDLADATARELHVVGAFGVAGAALGGVVADLAVQRAQGIEHAVVEVAAEHEGQHHAAQRLHGRAADAGLGRDDAALEPCKAFPFAALYLQVVFQRGERHGRGAGVAVGAQCQIHAEHTAVLGGVADGAVDDLDGAREVFVVGNAPAPVGRALRFALVLIDIDEVDVA